MSIDIHADDERQFYVVFTPGDNAFWWQRFLKHRFKHCYVLIEDGENSIMVSHRGFRLDVRNLYAPASVIARAQAREGGCPVLAIRHKPEAVPTHRTVMTCVSTVINVIGLRGVFALTPHSLYCSLQRCGAEILEA